MMNAGRASLKPHLVCEKFMNGSELPGYFSQVLCPAYSMLSVSSNLAVFSDSSSNNRTTSKCGEREFGFSMKIAIVRQNLVCPRGFSTQADPRWCVIDKRKFVGLNPFDNHGNTLTAADASRSQSVATITSLQFAQERQHQTRSGRRERMAKCDRSAIHVRPFAI